MIDDVREIVETRVLEKRMIVMLHCALFKYLINSVASPPKGFLTFGGG